MANGRGKYGKPPVIHDWLYWQQSYTRKQADKIYLEAMLITVADYRDQGLKSLMWDKLNSITGKNLKHRWLKFKSHVFYWFVRGFGLMAWYKNKMLKARGRVRVVSATIYLNQAGGSQSYKVATN